MNGKQLVEAAPPDLLSVISRAAADPKVDVTKMEALLRLQREIMADHARTEFNAAYTRLTDRVPPVKKNGTITLSGGNVVPFARWEDINVTIQPLLREEGLGLTFSSRHENSGLVVIGTLVHRDGHSMSAEMWVPPDASGSGTGRNQLQALGSALSYGKRYVTEMLLNIVREGQDDDGTGGARHPRRGRAPAGWRPEQTAVPLDKARQACRDGAAHGTDSLAAVWRGLKPAERRELGHEFLDEMKRIATTVDLEATT